ncbi:FAD-dependent monooxygenase, partial [Micromonospora sp. STR1s_5]|nr:FAD-dependent monooxygenase [Micromonospora sp. STR1s_5]
MGRYASSRFDYVTPPELRGGGAERRPVVIVGAGPVASRPQSIWRRTACRRSCSTTTTSSRPAAARSAGRNAPYEIFDRLGVADRMVAKGVTWQRGRVHRGDDEIYSFDLLPEGGHKMPAFINLQQYYVEEYLVARAEEFPGLIELRWKNKAVGLRQLASGIELEVETPDGLYRLEADWVIAADGASSPLRRMLGLPFEGHQFEERFLIADVRMEAPFPNERLFWFEPTFHAGQSALLHKQPDDVFRIDFQLGPDADPVLERQPERV